MTNYRDYGYTDTAGSHTQAYLSPALIRLLDKDNNRTILDLGCGNGAMVRFLLDKGYNAFGVDASESGIQIASAIDPERFGLMDINDPSLPGNLTSQSFDTIISTEVIEHLYNPSSFIDLCKRLLPDGGELILSTPYHGYLKNLLISIAGKWDRHMNPLWDGGHIKMWSRETLTTLLEREGFRVTNFIGCGRVPYLWKSMVIKAKLLP